MPALVGGGVPAQAAAKADMAIASVSDYPDPVFTNQSVTYTVSGPGDIAVISKQPAGLGIIHLTLQVPATAAPGAHTLFIQNTNLDMTAASGTLEVR